ncbi:hypothetical protein L916_01612, partial [Phytophthora nicotianae]
VTQLSPASDATSTSRSITWPLTACLRWRTCSSSVVSRSWLRRRLFGYPPSTRSTTRWPTRWTRRLAVRCLTLTSRSARTLAASTRMTQWRTYSSVLTSMP